MYIWRERDKYTRSMILSNINPVLSLSLSQKAEIWIWTGKGRQSENASFLLLSYLEDDEHDPSEAHIAAIHAPYCFKGGHYFQRHKGHSMSFLQRHSITRVILSFDYSI